MNWQPIETAPKDGTWVQVWREPVTFGTSSPLVLARWHTFEDGESAWCWPEDAYDPFTDRGREYADEDVEKERCYEDVKFTHWMPLPEAPQ